MTKYYFIEEGFGGSSPQKFQVKANSLGKAVQKIEAKLGPIDYNRVAGGGGGAMKGETWVFFSRKGSARA